MQTKKILPIKCSLPSLIYGHIFNPLTIILAHEGTKEWFLSNYIQLCAPSEYFIYGEKDIEFLNFYPKYYSDFESFYLRTHNINESILNLTKDNLIDTIISWLDNNYYIETFLNESEITGTYMWKLKFERLNEQLIYGYDKDLRIFKLTAFNDKNHYGTIDISFDDFVKVFFSFKTQKYCRESDWISVGNKYGLVLYQFREDVEYNFNIKSLVIQLDEYLNCKNTALHYTWLNEEKINFVFGVDVYTALTEWLSLYETEFVDFRSLFGLWDHKKIMLERLRFLEENNYLDTSKQYSHNYEKVEKIANKVRLLVLKYNMVRNKKIICDIIELLNSMKNQEFDILKNTFNDLESYLD